MALVKVDNESTDAGSQSQALVLALPEDWPRLKNIEQLKYLQCTGVTHTAVNKAQCHLELLQNAIEDWFEKRSESASDKNRHHSDLKSTKSTISQPQNEQLSDEFIKKQDTSEKSLKVIGVGQRSYHYYSEDPGVPYLGADEVISEVVTLLAKLECDRRDTEKAIVEERRRVAELAERIDRLSEAKLLQIPKAVQAEHEACIEDIAELQWHVQSKKKSLVKSKRRHDKSERRNNEIKEEIAFIKEHDPLVKEKLQIELKKINTIRQENQESNRELETTQQHLNITETKNKRAHQSADQERKKLQQDIDRNQANLDKAKNAVAQAEQQFVELGNRIESTKEKIKLEQEESEILKVRNSNEYEKQKILQAAVDELLRVLRHDEYQFRLLEQEKYEMEETEERTRVNQESQRSEMRSGVNHKEDKYTFLRREADEEQTEYEHMENKMKECEKQKKDDERNLERMDRELERTQEELQKTIEDFTKVANEHSEVTKKLDTEEKKVRFVEDSLKGTITQLQKQIEDEISTRDNLVVRIATDTKDLGQQKKDFKVKRAKLRKMADDMEKAVNLIEGKVAKLRKEAAEKRKFVEKLEIELAELQKEKQAIEEKLDSRIGELRPVHEQVKNELVEIEKKLSDIAWQIEMMNKKIKDIFDQSGMINKSKLKIEDACKVLQDELKKLEIELNAKTRKEDSLTSRISAIESRMSAKHDQHRRLQEERKQVENDLKTKYQEALATNKEVAGKYRSLQNEVFQFREGLLDLLNEKLVYEDAMKDCKQVCRLQSRMHAALHAYLRYKRSYAELRMEDMQIRGKKNTHTSKALQTQINGSLSNISDFLHSEMDVLMHGQRVRKDTHVDPAQQTTKA